MRVIRSMAERTCLHCGNLIAERDVVVNIRYKVFNPVLEKEYWKYKWYHLVCYPKHIESYIEEQLMKRERKQERKKSFRGRGRPTTIVHTDWKRRRQINSLISYHKKQGHEDRVKELEAERESITIK